jgi:hypothetical protein
MNRQKSRWKKRSPCAQNVVHRGMEKEEAAAFGGGNV